MKTFQMGEHTVLLDDEDAYLWELHGWCPRGGQEGRRYVGACAKVDGKWTSIYIHRIITNAPKGVEVDHENGNRMDNTRKNLRLATRSQNEQNKLSVRPESQTGVRGVTIRKRKKNPYVAYVYVNNKRHYMGFFSTIEEADRAAKEGRRTMMTHAKECAEAF